MKNHNGETRDVITESRRKKIKVTLNNLAPN